MNASLVGALLLASPGPRDAPPPLPPGGYYGVGEVPEVAPPDGDRSILTGSILFPLGVLRIATGFFQVELASPARCTYGASSCASLTNFGYVGVASGVLMLGTGATFLGIGLARRGRHRRWKAARNLAMDWRVAPLQTPGGGGARLQLRF